MLEGIDGDDAQLAREAQFGHNSDVTAPKSVAFDQIFPLTGIAVLLPLYDCTGEYTAFNVKIVNPSASISSSACKVTTY